ncbi:MAG: TRAP transporter substrate-binding protein [Betaproteobacteria bacterium]
MKTGRLAWLMALGLSVAAAPVGAQTVMKAGTATINDVQHEYLKRFAERVQKQAGGKLKVEVYPAEQLGNNARMLEGLSLGTVEAVIGPPEFIVGVDPRFQIVGAPGLVKDMQHAVRLTADAKFREALFGFGEARGIKGIGLVMYGGNAWATRKPVQRLADFKGLKVRVLASQMHTVPLERIGATGVPMPPSEAVQAIASGAIDGVRTGMTIFTTFKYYDIVKNVTMLDGDGMIYSMFYVAKKWFDALPKDLQQLVLDTSRAIEPEMNQYAVDQNLKAESEWKARGGQITRITGADQAEFQKRMLAAADEVAQKNPRIKEAYQLMLERAKATEK